MTTNSNKPSTIFWIIGVLALIWNGMGAYMYIQQAYKTDAFKAMYPDEKVLEMVMNTPSWVMGAFAIAVFGGVLGAILLLLKKKLAKTLFLISFIAIIVQMFYNVFISGAMEVYGPGAVIMPILTLVIGAFLIIFSKKSTEKGWLS